MASFLDTQPTTFNQYITQVPDDYIKIGLTKQAQYDEGVNKVRQYYQSIAGLDVDPKYKEYLGSAVNNLQTELKKITSADFSDAQLVNSVGSLVGNIGKDPILQAGVYSYSNLQKQSQLIEKAKEDGSYAPENEWFLNKQYEGWSHNPDLKVAFTGKYIPYRDVTKKIKEIAKEVGIDETLVQNMFDKNGRPNMYMIETLTKGKDPNKIYTALMGGLDQGDFQQIGITGMYKYRNVEAKDLFPVLQQSNQEYVNLSNDRKLQILEQINNYKTQRLKIPIEQRDILDKEIEKLEGQVEIIDKNIEENNQELNESFQKLNEGDQEYLDQIRAKIHTNQFLNQMSFAFSSKETHTKFMDSPLWKSIMEEKKFQFDQWKTKQQLALEAERNSISREANKLKKQELGIESIPIPGGIAADIDLPSTIAGMTDQAITERDGLFTNLAMDYLVEINKDKGLTREQIITNVKNWAKAANVSPEQWLSSYGARRYSEIRQTLETKPENKSVVAKIDDLNLNIETWQKGMEYANKQAGEQTNVSTSSIVSQLTPVTLEIGDRAKGMFGKKKITLSPNDIMDFIEYSSAGLFSSKEKEITAKSAENRLSKRFSKDDLSFLKQYFSERETSASGGKSWTRWLNPLAPITEPFYQTHPVIQKARELYYSSGYSDFRQKQKKTYQSTFSAFFPNNQALSMEGKAKQITISKISTALQGRPELEQVIPKLAEESSTVTIKTVPAITGFGENQYEVVVTGKDGTSITAPINQGIYTYLTGQQPSFVNQSLNLMNIKVNTSPDKSSNKAGIGSVETSQFGKSAFKNIKNYNIIGGDFKRDKINPDIYFPYIYYKDNSGRVSIVHVEQPMSLGEVISFPEKINDNNFTTILKTQ